MRINKRRLKKRNRQHSLRIPHVVQQRFAKAIAKGDVPSDKQIKMAVELGVVKKTLNGHLDTRSLVAYFKTFIAQRKADDLRN